VKPFWITFLGTKPSDLPPGVGFGGGVGVTAIDEKDAMALVEAVLFTDRPVPAEYTIAWLRSLDDLDQGHVIPNMGFHMRRRVWFPNIPDPQVVDR
jgi:hypothetical protein